MAKYRYYIDDQEVFPLNAASEQYKYEKPADPGALLTFELDTTFNFDYSDPNSTFDFKAQEAADLCLELDFRIERRCGNTYAIFWEGVFAITEGTFEDNICQYFVKPRKKQYLLEDLEINIFDDPNRLFEDNQDGVSGVDLNGGAHVYPNWRYFDSCVLYIAKRSNPKITGLISNFFQINPDGPYPLPGTNFWTKMAFTSVTQIKDPVPSAEATRELITFKQMMSDLNSLFQVFWFIDSNYNLRIEHEIYFEGTLGLDLTQAKYKSYLLGKKAYNYNLDEFPKKETFKIAEHKSSCELVYSGLANISKNQNEKSYTTSRIRTGWREAFESTNDGVFLCATDGGSLSGEWRALLGGAPAYELYLNPFYLVTNVHVYLRPSLYALINYYQNTSDQAAISAGIIMQSVKPTKLQEEIAIPLCCDDDFNVRDQITTELGIGYVSKANFDAKSELLRIALKYKIDNCSGFTPDQLSCPMALWLKYNDIIFDTPGGPFPFLSYVQQWNDSSGNNRHATQAVQADKPWFIPNNPNGSAVMFFNQYDPMNPTVPTNLMHLTTPAFQLFPNKRGTIIIVFNSGFGQFGGTGLDLSAGPGFEGTILSTQDGGADDYFDLSAGTGFQSFAEAKPYPTGPTYIGTRTYQGPNVESNSVMVIRRGSDISLDVSWNGIPFPTNPMLIANAQPDSKPLVIGCNDNVNDQSSILSVISEILIYECALTDEEIEKILFYYIKNKLLTL